MSQQTRTRYISGVTPTLNEAITWDAPAAAHPARLMSQRSIDAVSRKAKDEWLALYADDCVLEDPVGPSFFDPEGKGHHGHEGISAFWDMAIAPIVEFRFHIRESFANGNACANIGTFTTKMADGTWADTELVTVYTLAEDGRIASMRAHWEVERTMASLRKEA